MDVTPTAMDAKWAELGRRFEPWVDWTGLEEEEALGWREHWALFTGPFYDLAYILANLGALSIWRAAESDPAGTWQRFTTALTLGNTLPLPELYRRAGAELPFDPAAVRDIAEFAAAKML
jgi:oligoendopeptidase F